MFRTLAGPLRIAAAGAAFALSLGALAVTGTATGLTPAAAAQDQAPAGPPAGGRRIMGQALMSLGLSDAQKQQIRGFVADARAKSQNADPDTRRANYKAAFAKIDTILTPDQRTRFHAKLDQLRKEREQGTQPQS
jgi:Spy/CpxP family protein refolding chaperone